MSIKRVSLLALLVASLLLLALATVGGIAAQEELPQGTKETLANVSTGFTYQGELQDGGSPANGVYDFRFVLHNALSGGAQVGSTVTVDDLIVSDGLFTVPLDFGNRFDGTALWLEIGVREGSSTGAYTILSPRQALAAAPYALGLRPGAVISGTVQFGYPVLSLSSSSNGMHVDAARSGIAVDARGGSGVLLWASNHGLYVGSAGGDGLYIGSAGDDGVDVTSAGDDGVVVLSAADDGVYVDTAGDKGVAVLFAGGNGVYANTTRTNGEWGMRTPDKITASNVTFSSLTLIAQVAGPEPLSPGDLVAASSVTEPLPGSTIPLALVRPADAHSFTGILGVVESRMALSLPATQLATEPENPDGEEQPGDEPPDFYSTGGPAQAGDYVALTVFGVTQIKVNPMASIQPGQRLTASEAAGQARALRTETLNGMVVTEGAPVIGIALSTPDAQGRVWLLVNPQ